MQPIESKQPRVGLAGGGLDERATPGWQYAVSSGILGWVLDAFDFFVLVFLLDTLAANFNVAKSAIVLTITATLAMRPVGALIFGALADRYGRRRPLVGCVLYFSIVTVLSAYAPNYAVFLVLRALYGIGMGGYWGVGASLAMESAPVKSRGLLSGMMQSGYPMGYLLASVATVTIEPRLGWRAMFYAGVPVAVVTALLARKAPESAAWEQHKKHSVGEIFKVLYEHKASFIYLLLMMAVINCLSHGTQDLYPDFLKTVHGFSKSTTSHLAVLYNCGAIVGALIFGQLSERWGRRRCVMLALCVSLAAIYPWAYGGTIFALTLGSMFMQAGVQGAYGIIPAHLNELSPDSARSLFPGIVYQLGVLIAAAAVPFEYWLRGKFGYEWALVVFEGSVIAVLMLIFAFGPERKGRSFRSA